MESTASGFLAAVELAHRLRAEPPVNFPQETALGALAAYISDPTVTDFQPMGANMGILPPLDEPVRDKKERYRQISARGYTALRELLESEEDVK